MAAFEFLLLFLTGYNFSVPGYGWFIAVQPAHAVYLDNLLFAAYLLVAGLPRGFSKRSDAVVYSTLIALLAVLGIISPALNPTRLEDLGQALRLALLALYTLHAVHWSRTRDTNFVLRAFLAGMAVGGAANVYVSFVHPYLRIAFLPALYARNGTGGPLGLSIAFGAWLFLLRKRRLDTIIAVAVSLIGASAAAISFSKTSMLIGLFGVGAWMFVLGHGVTWRGVRNRALAVVAVVIAATVYVRQSEQLSDLVNSFQYSLGIKFASAALSLNDQASTQWRYQYLWGVAEIVSRDPLTGVGASGFYDAIIATEPFRAGLMGEEDPSARTQGGANPHNSFLWVAAANGIPGFFTGVALYIGFLAVFRRALKHYGPAGRGVWWCITFGYFVFGMTLPSLFNTMILYLPAAIAMGITTKQRIAERAVAPAVPRLA